MNYHDGTPITLGDIVTVPVPDGTARARVAMLGDTYEHLDLDAQFLDWVTNEKQLESTSIVVEWIDGNLSRATIRSSHRSATTCFRRWIGGCSEK